ncbi:MAG: hypothetical protein OER56_08835 [Hyphomicrobiales bacterium]|nr:hypothetical protein [Hyphomicrobiales bacterium]
MDEIVTNRGWQAGKHQRLSDRGDRAEQVLPEDRSAAAPQNKQNNRPQTKQRQALRRKLQAFGRRRKQADQVTQANKTDQASKTDQAPANARPPEWTNARPPEWNLPRQPARARPPEWTGPLQIDNTPKSSRKPRPSIATGLVISAIAVSALFALGFEGSRLVNSYMEISAVESALESGKVSKQAAATAPLPSRTKLAELSPAEAGPRTIVAAPSIPASLSDTSLSDTAQTAAPLSSVPPAAVAAVVPDVKTDTPLIRATRLMSEGHKMLATGDVLGARSLFTKSLQLGLPEAALALGRAHDPEYLALIRNANASPSVAVASAMYRQWYRKSIAAGSIAEGVQLDRLLHSMNQQ